MQNPQVQLSLHCQLFHLANRTIGRPNASPSASKLSTIRLPSLTRESCVIC